MLLVTSQMLLVSNSIRVIRHHLLTKNICRDAVGLRNLNYNVPQLIFHSQLQDIKFVPKRNYARHEPDYLDPKGPQIGKYEEINFQLTGYDYTILEEFGKFLHNSAERFGFDVEDAWATPSKHLKVIRLKPESTVVDTEFKLQVYERNIQVINVSSTILPLFVDAMQSSLPGGVNLKVHPHFKEYTEVRYVPDLTLKEVKLQLQELAGERETRKRR